MAQPILTGRTRQANGRDIVVVGASAGGFLPLTQLMAWLPRDLPAALFIVRHMQPTSESEFAAILGRSGPLRCKDAKDNEPIEHGVVYIAPPDHHLIVKHGHVRVTRGPREDRWRPSINVLFRSAAVAYGPRVIGIVMSGMLDDGTRGLAAVKACGGIAVVQDPSEADFPDMPENALANVAVDLRLKFAEMNHEIERLVRERAPAGGQPPAYLLREVRVAEMGASVSYPETESGKASVMQCPECGGPMFEHAGKGEAHYRCLVGHAWDGLSLLAASDERLEGTLWAAIHQFEQRTNLLAKLAERERSNGRERSSIHYENLANEARDHARMLRHLLLGETSGVTRRESKEKEN